MQTAEKWYAVRVASNCERRVAQALRGRDIEPFLPLYSYRRRWTGVSRIVERPLFPGYVFARLDIGERMRVLVIPGVVYVVGFGRLPVPVPDEELAAVRRVVDSHLRVQECPYLKTGDRVRIDCGPLAGLEGKVLCVKGAYRLVLSVMLLRRSVAVELERDWVRPESEMDALARRAGDAEAATRVY